jgi:serine/threonine protein kinase
MGRDIGKSYSQKLPHPLVIGYNPVTLMAITIGQHLGSYEITALLGKGGMGEVYRARDTKLKRDVAIKILPDEFSRDADRVRRFQREAEVLFSQSSKYRRHLRSPTDKRFAVPRARAGRGPKFSGSHQTRSHADQRSSRDCETHL